MRRLGILAILIAIALTILLPILPGCGENRTIIRTLAFSPDGQRLAVSRIDWTSCNIDFKWCTVDPERSVCLVDVTSAAVAKVVDRSLRPGNQGTGWAYVRVGGSSLAFTADGHSLFVLQFGGGAIQRFDLTSGQEATFFDPGPETPIRAFCHSHDKTMLAGVGNYEGLWLLDAETAAPTLTNPRVLGVDFGGPRVGLSPDKRWLAVHSGASLRLFDANANLERGAVIPCSGPFAFGPQREELAVANHSTLSIRDLATAENRDFSLKGEIDTVQYVPDGRLAVAIDKDVMVLDVDTRTEMRRLGIDHWVTAVAASPNGEIIAIGDSGGGVTLWNVADGTSTAVTIPGGNKPFWMPLVVTLAILLPCLAYWLRVRRNRSYVTGSDNDAAHPSQGERG